jgi:alpha-tubulin suppressor-like RCC1 family protein
MDTTTSLIPIFVHTHGRLHDHVTRDEHERTLNQLLRWKLSRKHVNIFQTIMAWGNNTDHQLAIDIRGDTSPTLCQGVQQKDIIMVKGGTSFTLFLTAQGRIYSVGSNQKVLKILIRANHHRDN